MTIGTGASSTGAQLRRDEDPPQHADRQRDGRRYGELDVNVQLASPPRTGAVGARRYRDLRQHDRRRRVPPGACHSCRAPFDQAGAVHDNMLITARRLIPSWGGRRFDGRTRCSARSGQPVPGQHLPGARPRMARIGRGTARRSRGLSGRRSGMTVNGATRTWSSWSENDRARVDRSARVRGISSSRRIAP